MWGFVRDVTDAELCLEPSWSASSLACGASAATGSDRPCLLVLDSRECRASPEQVATVQGRQYGVLTQQNVRSQTKPPHTSCCRQCSDWWVQQARALLPGVLAPPAHRCAADAPPGAQKHAEPPLATAQQVLGLSPRRALLRGDVAQKHRTVRLQPRRTVAHAAWLCRQQAHCGHASPKMSTATL